MNVRSLLSICVVGLGGSSQADALQLYVAPNGNDAWAGDIAAPNDDGSDGPLATLDGARDALRRLRAQGKIPEGGVTVWLRAGTYRLSHSFALTDKDSGTAQKPVTFAAYRSETVRVTGSQAVTGFGPLTDDAVRARLQPAARDHVVQADLKALGIEDYGDLASRGFGRRIVPSHSELFVDDKPMTLARYPNTGWLKTVDAPDGPKGGKFSYDDSRPATWKDFSDIWVHGYWTWDWADSYEKVHSIDTDKKVVATEPPHGVYGYAKGKRFVFLNVLEELDQPGEWFLDRSHGILYLWPADTLDKARVELSTLGNPLVTLRQASYVRFQGLIFECGRASGIDAGGGTDDRIEGCTIRNLGMYGVTLDGTNCVVRSCDIYDTSDGGVVLNGGDRATLKRGDNAVVNCDIHDYQRWDRTYRPGVHIFGVGNRVANCRIHDAPHCAILLHGNDHLIEYNDIFRVCTETTDAGAFYMGRNFTELGNVVQYNYFHQINSAPDVNSVYLDDFSSGTTVYGNVFVDAGRCVLIGGGRDNKVENNIMVDGRPAVYIDARGQDWATKYFDPSGDRTLWDEMDAVKADQPPYSTRYPNLVGLKNDTPAAPKRNRILNNIAVGGQWLKLINNLKPEQVPVLDNWVGGDPGFVSLRDRDFHLLPDTPGTKLKFKPLPLEKFGLQKDGFRSKVPPVWGPD